MGRLLFFDKLHQSFRVSRTIGLVIIEKVAILDNVPLSSLDELLGNRFQLFVRIIGDQTVSVFVHADIMPSLGRDLRQVQRRIIGRNILAQPETVLLHGFKHLVAVPTLVPKLKRHFE